MDIQRVNAVLNRAIVSLQESEIEVVVEATIGGYTIPTPAQLRSKTKKKPQVMTRDEYLGLHGVEGVYVEPGESSPGWIGKRAARVAAKRHIARSREYASEKKRRSKEYDEKVRSGKIRAPSYFEKLFQKAAGNPENPSVQAAIRLIARHVKKGNLRKKSDGSYEIVKKKG